MDNSTHFSIHKYIQDIKLWGKKDITNNWDLWYVSTKNL